MKKNLFFLFILGMTLTVLQGCSQQQKAATSQDAIQQAQAMKTVDEQVKYLVSQANSFINSQKFEESITIAQHILQNLDANSQEAKNIIQQAKAELQKTVEKKMAEVKTDLTNKINSLGK